MKQNPPSQQQIQKRPPSSSTARSGAVPFVALLLAALVVGSQSTSFTSRHVSAFAGGTSPRSRFAHNQRHSQPSTAAAVMLLGMAAAGSDPSSVIVSPFDDSRDQGASSTSTTTTSDAGMSGSTGPLDLTWENVELVLDEMRPYLIQDGGNVKIADIDGPVVRLQLEGACGTCPSSTQTMKMGLERGLKERIPEIQEVVQSMPEGPPLNEEQVDVILDGVRPFLKVAGGSIDLDRFEGLDGLQPTIWLKMGGASATLNSVKLEIAQRLQRHFMVAGLRVEWVE